MPTGPQPLLRPIAPRDRSALASLLSRIDNFNAGERSVAQELIDAAIANPSPSEYQVIVAEIAGGIAGYVCFGRTPMTERAWDLYWIAVDPAHRNSGLGRKLCEALYTRLAQTGGGIVRVETSSQESYTATMGFYVRAGFAEAGRIPDFYKPGDDLVIYFRAVRAGS